MHLMLFLKDQPRNIVIFDPCCGTNAIGNFLRQQGFTNIIEQDLYTKDSKIDYLKSQAPDYDIMITNIPFCDKFNFFKKAFESGKHFLCFIYVFHYLLFR